MMSDAILHTSEQELRTSHAVHTERNGKRRGAPTSSRLTVHAADNDAPNRQAELFYLQKQIQSQTPMVIVLADGTHIEGCIEWYDRNTLKVRGRERVLVYKPSIKYMYKLGENGS